MFKNCKLLKPKKLLIILIIIIAIGGGSYFSFKKFYKPAPKFVYDVAVVVRDQNSSKKDEDAEGATGSIRLVVTQDKYYVLLPRLSLSDGTFDIEE